MTLAFFSKKTIKVIFWVALITFIFEFFGYYFGFQLSDIIYHKVYYEKNKQSLADEYGISFKESLTLKDYSARWTSNPILADQTVVKQTQINVYLAGCFKTIEKEIKKLPLKKNTYFKQFYCIDDLVVMGTPSGGTYDVEKKAVYLVMTNGDDSRSSKSRIKRTFHHELSSLLMRNFNFDERAWRAAHGEGFQYEKDKDPTYSWMYLHGYVDPVDEDGLLDRGLLRQYADTGVENDFNIYASQVFTNPRRMKKLISEYPIIQRKYEVFKAFYLSIDEGFAPVFEKIDG